MKSQSQALLQHTAVAFDCGALGFSLKVMNLRLMTRLFPVDDG